ncbi:unnamed protein product, partial [Ascophyllum nodosum]
MVTWTLQWEDWSLEYKLEVRAVQRRRRSNVYFRGQQRSLLENSAPWLQTASGKLWVNGEKGYAHSRQFFRHQGDEPYDGDQEVKTKTFLRKRKKTQVS